MLGECIGFSSGYEASIGHMCGRNGTDGKRPTHSRPGLSAHVVNADGDLCLYVNGWDEHAYWYAPGMMRMYADHHLHWRSASSSCTILCRSGPSLRPRSHCSQ